MPRTLSNVSSGVVLASGHAADGQEAPLPAFDPGLTFVWLMAFGNLESLGRRLIAADFSWTLQAAVASRVAHPGQACTRTPLVEIAQASQDAGLSSLGNLPPGPKCRGVLRRAVRPREARSKRREERGMSLPTPSSVFLGPGTRAELTRLSEHGYPHEACGLLLGRPDPERVSVHRVHPARNLNTERAHDRYELDPADQLGAETQARRAGLEVVGIWHTHPDHPAEPSETDRRAAWPGWSYLIASVRGGQVRDLRSWRLTRNRFQEEEIRPMPEVLLRVPSPLRPLTDGASQLVLHGTDVGEALLALRTDHPDLLARLLGDRGELCSSVNVFRGSRDLRQLAGLTTPIETGDVLSILPAAPGDGSA